MNRGDNIKIEKFNNIINFELPTYDINIMAGNNFNYKKDIINALNTYFSNSKEDIRYIQYNGDSLKILDKDLLISKKEYRVINLDIVNVDLISELSFAKTSVLRELMNIYIDTCYNKSESSLLVNSIFEEMIEEINNNSLFCNNIGCGIDLVMSNMELTTKSIIDSIFNIELTKNGNNLPLDYLSYYEQTIVMLKIIEALIDRINGGIKIILIVNNIDNKLTDFEIRQLYSSIETLAEKNDLYIYIFTNNKYLIDYKDNILKTVLINVNNSLVYLEDLDEFVVKINQSYPIFLDDDDIINKVKNAIINNHSYIGNFVEISDNDINNLEYLTIIKILNDVLDFKYKLNLNNEYLNNRFYSYLTS